MSENCNTVVQTDNQEKKGSTGNQEQWEEETKYFIYIKVRTKIYRQKNRKKKKKEKKKLKKKLKVIINEKETICPEWKNMHLK